jgi:hypothetical protein
MRLRGPVALGLVLALGAGCTSDPPAPDIAKVLAVAADQLGTEPLSFTFSINSVPPSAYGEIESLEHWALGTKRFTVRRIGPDLYFKLERVAADRLPPGFYDRTVGTKWVHGPLPADNGSEDIYRDDYPFTHVHEAARGTAIHRAGDVAIVGAMPPGVSVGGASALGFAAELDDAGHFSHLGLYTTVPDRNPLDEKLDVNFVPYDGPAVTAPPPSEVATVSDQDYLVLRSMLTD